MQRLARSTCSLLAIACGAAALAQSAAPSEDRAASGANDLSATLVTPPQFLQGDVLAGPFDCSTPTANIRLLGVQKAWGYYWVTGGNAAAGPFFVHQFELNGNFVQSFAQVIPLTTTTSWGMRDLAADEPNNKLYGGMEGLLLQEYTFADPTPGGLVGDETLVHTADYSLTALGVNTTIRALARDPSNGHFYTQSFTTPMYEFTLPNTLVATHANAGTSAYGLAFDTLNTTLWSFSQTAIYSTPFPCAAGGNADLVDIVEVDLTNLPTGRGFAGVMEMIDCTNIAGGIDFEDDGLGNTRVIAFHQSNVDKIIEYEVDTSASGPTAYCTSGTTSAGCVPVLSGSNNPSISGAGSPCVITCSQLEEAKNGLMFFGLSDITPLPWSAGSTSFLCVKSPTNRTTSGTSSTGVNPSDPCEGVLSLDFSAWLTANPAHLGAPHSAGDMLYCQEWYRDPATSKTTGLSNGLILTFTP